MGWRTMAYGPRRMSVWPSLTVTVALQLPPNCSRAQIEKQTPDKTMIRPIAPPAWAFGMKDHARHPLRKYGVNTRTKARTVRLISSNLESSDWARATGLVVSRPN